MKFIYDYLVTRSVVTAEWVEIVHFKKSRIFPGLAYESVFQLSLKKLAVELVSFCVVFPRESSLILWAL